jgi:hypothetical protein
MAQIWTCRRPQLRLYTEWDGTNLAELEAACSYEQNPTLTTTVQDAPAPGPSGLVSFAVTADD